MLLRKSWSGKPRVEPQYLRRLINSFREQARSHIWNAFHPVGAGLLAKGPDLLITTLRNNDKQDFSVYLVGFCDSLAFGDPGAGTYDAS
ncbi:hypothetical protein EMIT0P218_160068 [Pseudomonas sp. IT-P218]